MGVISRLFRRQIDKEVNEKAAKAAAKHFDKMVQENIGKLRDKYGVGAVFPGAPYPSGNPFGGLLGNQVGGAKYPYGLAASGASQLYSHYDIRQNARTAYHDTLQAKAVVDRFADTVVDTGLVAESAIDFERLGITPEEAEKIGRTLDAGFDAWSKSKKQHRAGNMNFYQYQRLYEICQHRDNDMFTRLYYSDRKTLLNPLQFDMIDPNQIRGYGWTTTYGPFFQADGITRDPDGVEISYKVWVQNQKDGQISDVDIPAQGEYGRLFMLHGFNPEFAGQLRGYSRLSGALQELQNLTDFSLAELKKAINQSNWVGAIENDQQDPSNPFQPIMTGAGGFGPAGMNLPQSDVTEEELLGPQYSRVPEGLLNTPGSAVLVDMDRGDKLKFLQNTSPVTSFEQFTTAVFSVLSASLSMPIEVVLMRFNSNYTAARGSLILLWRQCMIWRNEMASDLLDPVREMWISEEIAAGRISLPGWQNPHLRAAWLNCVWNGAPMPQIDPTKEADANKTNVELGATTLDRVARDLNGSSGAANRAKLSRELKELPTPPWSPAAGFGGGPAPAPEKEETEPESEDDDDESDT